MSLGQGNGVNKDSNVVRIDPMTASISAADLGVASTDRNSYDRVLARFAHPNEATQVRIEALDRLVEIGNVACLGTLQHVMKYDDNVVVAANVAKTLGVFGAETTSSVLPLIIALKRSSNYFGTSVADEAAKSLAKFGANLKNYEVNLADAFLSPHNSEVTLLNLCRALGDVGAVLKERFDHKAAKKLRGIALGSYDYDLKKEAVIALGKIDPEAATTYFTAKAKALFCFPWTPVRANLAIDILREWLLMSRITK